VRNKLNRVRALVQRVARAAVRVDESEVASIGPGLLVLLGVTHDDGEAQADRLADKVRALRVFPDAGGRMNDPLGDREVLCVSQFTLYGDARKGNRPTYVAAARPEHAEPLYERFCERLGAQRGVFGAVMAVELVNDGPFTIWLDTADR
jgi:D-aminoacyl-tRNA deacylase